MPLQSGLRSVQTDRVTSLTCHCKVVSVHCRPITILTFVRQVSSPMQTGYLPLTVPGSATVSLITSHRLHLCRYSVKNCKHTCSGIHIQTLHHSGFWKLFFTYATTKNCYVMCDLMLHAQMNICFHLFHVISHRGCSGWRQGGVHHLSGWAASGRHHCQTSLLVYISQEVCHHVWLSCSVSCSSWVTLWN